MKLDEKGNKKKLSKRDMGLDMNDYKRNGYAPECVCEYIMTILNSNYDEWRMQNPDQPYTAFPFSFKKMSNSGCLLDFPKLTDVSKNVISKMTADQVYDRVYAWAAEYDPDFAATLAADPVYAKSILAIGRGGKKPRKDIAIWSEVKAYMGFFYDQYFTIQDDLTAGGKFAVTDIKAALDAFAAGFDMADDANLWFDKIKAIADSLGFASDMKAYKANPGAYRGNVADISMFLRVAVTGKLNSPDMYTVMQILGRDRVLARISAMRDSL